MSEKETRQEVNGCDLMDPRFTSCMSTNRNLSYCVINVIGYWLKLTQCDVSSRVDVPPWVGIRALSQVTFSCRAVFQFLLFIVCALKCYAICIFRILVVITKFIQQHWCRRKVRIRLTLCTDIFLLQFL